MLDTPLLAVRFFVVFFPPAVPAQAPVLESYRPVVTAKAGDDVPRLHGYRALGRPLSGHCGTVILAGILLCGFVFFFSNRRSRCVPIKSIYASILNALLPSRNNDQWIGPLLYCFL